jgi:UDP-N-acetylmuramate dehydrogenase
VSPEPGDVARRLQEVCRGRVARDVPLSRLTTYRLGGPAAVYVEPAGEEDLGGLARVLAEHRMPVLVVGRGSNLVVSDRGFPGAAVRLGADFSWVAPGGDAALETGGATPLPVVANWAARRGLAGIEFAIAIPGSVGGAVRMNAGAHEGAMSDRLERVRVFDLEAASVTDRSAADLDLSYRHSNLADGDVVLSARVALIPAHVEEVRDRMEGYRKHRAATQPGAVQNAGSVFKNPPGDHAGKLVEAAGLKGFRVGGARVSELHANFFMADDGCASQDVYDLVRTVQARVREESGIELQPEIRFVGAFENTVPQKANKT